MSSNDHQREAKALNYKIAILILQIDKKKEAGTQSRASLPSAQPPKSSRAAPQARPHAKALPGRSTPPHKQQLPASKWVCLSKTRL